MHVTDSEEVESVSGLNSTLLHATEVYHPASIIASEYFRLQSWAVDVQLDNLWVAGELLNLSSKVWCNVTQFDGVSHCVGTEEDRQ